MKEKNNDLKFPTPCRSPRQEYNVAILSVLYDIVMTFSEQRFGQIICNYVFPDYRGRDPFFEESKETFEKLKSYAEELKQLKDGSNW